MASVHLLVLIHGMWGSPQHLVSMAETIRKASSERRPLVDTDGIEFEALVAETNLEDLTYDGIDNCGERVAEELYREVENIRKEGRIVTRFSVTGYSLGGLIGRYLVGILLQRKFFEDIAPVNFNTFATPHVGLPRYPNFVSAISNSLGPRLLSRTGEQLFVSDKWSPTGRPLLLVMADPERIFYEALRLFRKVSIYANSIHDVSSPYLTSSIELEDPFLHYETNGIELTFHDEYPHLIKSYSLPAQPPTLAKPAVFSGKWFKSFNQSKRPLFPPALQFGFPYNIILLISLPILVPTFMGMVLVRFTLASRSSRRRIESLEKDESYAQNLVHVVAQLEKQMEDAVADLVDDSGNTSSPDAVVGTARHNSQPAGIPVLKEVQKAMVKTLNALPGLQKQRAFFEFVRNSHAMIISRDSRKFKLHEQGQGILNHWADNFVF